MSSINRTRLAGADNLIAFHFNGTKDAPKPVPSTKRKVASPKKAIIGVRPGFRRPLSEKRVDPNLVQSNTKSRSIIHRESFPQKPPTPATAPLVLPYISSPSEFKLDSFAHILLIPPPSTPAVHLCEPTPPSTPRSSHTFADSSQASLPFSPPPSTVFSQAENDENQYPEDEAHGGLAFQHPNSPYVPWGHRTRRDILRPMSPMSGYSSHYVRSARSASRTRCFSRSGARAPEPDSTASLMRGSRTRVGKIKTWKTVGAKVRLNVKNVTKRLTFFQKRRAGSVRAYTISPNSSFSSYDGCSVAASSFVNVSNAECSSPKFSFGSSKGSSNSLHAWLAARQIAMEREYEPENEQTMEEYDQTGSWIHNRVVGSSSECDMPEYQSYRSGFLSTTQSNWCESKEHGFPRMDSLPEMTMTTTSMVSSRVSLGRMSVPDGWRFY